MSETEQFWGLVVWGVAITIVAFVARYFGDDDPFGRLKRKRARRAADAADTDTAGE